ncbi:MAG: rhodanese-like domain-containing protein [Bacteroidia bacterium]
MKPEVKEEYMKQLSGFGISEKMLMDNWFDGEAEGEYKGFVRGKEEGRQEGRSTMRTLHFILFLLFFSLQACGQQGTPSNRLDASDVPPFSALSPAQFLERLKTDSQVVVVDVRTAEECKEGIIPGAFMVDFYQEGKLKQAMASWDPSRTYLVYCRSGGRSGQTLELMQSSGFKKAYHLEGGMGAWMRADGPVVAPDK